MELDDIIKQLHADVNEDGKGWLDSTLNQLRIRTDQAKEDVYRTITSHSSQFSQTFDNAKEIESQVGFVSSSLKHVMDIIHKHSGEEEEEESSDGKSKNVSALKMLMKQEDIYRDVNAKLTETKEAIRILEQLSDVHR